MKRVGLVIAIVLISLIGLGTHPRTRESHQKEKDGRVSHLQHEIDVYTCPMHPDVKSDKPGKCPKCGMTLVLVQEKEEAASQSSDRELSGKQKALKAKKLLEEAKQDLAYHCCLYDPCDRCALDHQSCRCSKDLRAGKGVCSDCYAGWQTGEGKDIPGMTKEKVKPNFHSHKH